MTMAIPQQKLDAIVDRLRGGTSALIAESRALGFSSNDHLRRALQKHLGKDVYAHIMDEVRHQLDPKSEEIIAAARAFLERVQPTTGRGVGYHLFVKKLIQSMGEMGKVYRLLVIARERGIIPWDWIVDETRGLELEASWDGLADYGETVQHWYDRNYWAKRFQPRRVEVWSEKGTVRGMLAPVLKKYHVGFRVLHGFASATVVHDVAQETDGRPLIVLYVGDWDPSGLYMSEEDLPSRLKEYGGDHVDIRRVALKQPDTDRLPSFKADEKKDDSRYRWFVEHHGDECWELDAMDARDLRRRVDSSIERLRDRDGWKRCEEMEAEERDQLSDLLSTWPDEQEEDELDPEEA